MLDPLSALSLAGTVVQLVDFSIKIVRGSKKIFQEGDLIEIVELEDIISDLIELIARIKCSYIGQSKLENLNDNEKALISQGRTVVAIARELVDALEKLKIKGRPTIYSSFAAMIKAAFSQSALEVLLQRLNRAQHAMQFHILVSLRLDIDAQGIIQRQAFIAMDSQLKQIILLILEKHEHVFKELEEQQIRIDSRFDMTDDLIRQSRKDILKAIAEITNSKDDLPSRARPNIVPVDLTESNCVRIQDRILFSLRFSGMYDRHDEIEPPHKETFKWILSDTLHTQDVLDNLIQWLRGGVGCYWINGKAASGKSTLMKYLIEAPEIENALREWAGSAELVLCHFFFWNLGTSLQKSQQGIYRCILHSVLSAYPELIPKVMPGFYNDTYRDSASPRAIDDEFRLFPLSMRELKLAFLRLIEQFIQLDGKLCIFLDGVDEYHGDHAELAAYLKSITSPHVKMVVSSRPIPACKTAFAGFHSLRLQDLTRVDIETFVTDKLESHPRADEIKTLNEDPWSNLIQGILNKAQGVFLWVILVIRSLLRGMDNYDTIKELQKRLDDAPPEIEDLYERMLSSMESAYKIQAAQYYRILLESIQSQRSKPLTLLEMSFAMDQEGTDVLALDMSSISPTEIERRCRTAEARFTSRCCGLIETREVSAFSTVMFLHKTVVDFLRKKEQWISVDPVSSPQFDCDHTLLWASMALFKYLVCTLASLPGEDWHQAPSRLAGIATKQRMLWFDLKYTIENILLYSHSLEQVNNSRYIPYVQALHTSLVSALEQHNFSQRFPLQTWPSFFGLSRPRRARFIKEHSPSLSLFQLGMPAVLVRNLTTFSRPLSVAEPALLAETVDIDYCRLMRTPRVLTTQVRSILSAGADPNQSLSKSDKKSAWQYGVEYLEHAVGTDQDDELSIYMDVLILLAEHGAKAGALITQNNPHLPTITAKKFLKQLKGRRRGVFLEKITQILSILDAKQVSPLERMLKRSS